MVESLGLFLWACGTQHYGGKPVFLSTAGKQTERGVGEGWCAPSFHFLKALPSPNCKMGWDQAFSTQTFGAHYYPNATIAAADRQAHAISLSRSPRVHMLMHMHVAVCECMCKHSCRGKRSTLGTFLSKRDSPF